MAADADGSVSLDFPGRTRSGGYRSDYEASFRLGKINMPEKRYIHAHEDIEGVVRFADSIGLLVLPQKLEEEDSRPWLPQRLRSFLGGTLLLYRPQWVTDAIKVIRITGGAFAGTYTVCPSINLSAIDLYFSGDNDIEGIRSLGVGSISFKREWLHKEAHEMRPSPPDVEVAYKQVCKHLLSNVVARGGVHRYHVCKEAVALAARSPTRPPFDYIEWPPPDLHKKRRE